MNLETFQKNLRRNIELLGEIISFLQKNYSNEKFLISRIRSVQGFLSQVENLFKKACEDSEENIVLLKEVIR